MSSSTVITGLVEFAHRTNDKSNITAFGSLKLGPWYEMKNISDINLKPEQYEEHLIVLCVDGSSGLGNSLNHTCTTADLSPPCIKDGCKINFCRKLSMRTFA